MVDFIIRPCGIFLDVLDRTEVSAHLRLEPQLLPKLTGQTHLQALAGLQVASRQKGVGISLGSSQQDGVTLPDDGSSQDM